MTKKNYGDNAEEPSLGNLGPVWLLKTKYRDEKITFSQPKQILGNSTL
jgi:hypothetical protein